MLSKIYRSNQGFQGPICRFVRLGEVGREKTREGGERRGRTLGQEGWAEVKCWKLGASYSSTELGAKIYGAELGARVTSAELTAMSSTVPRSSAPETLASRRVSSALTPMTSS